jgi:xanthine dehydrogenase YagR molybdenum-binding subunit
MKFENPATFNPIDQLKIIGHPTDRIDGPFKTTGTAHYAYERHDVVANPAYGYVVGSAIAKGRIVSIDLTEAKAAPGVLAIVTAENAGKLTKGNYNTAMLLGGPDIEHYHQAIAVVVAETFEQARAAAQLVRVDTSAAIGAFDLDASKNTAPKPKAGGLTGEPDTAVGDFESAFASAPVQLDATYTTPDQAHAMMEPHATTAAWEGDKLTLWTSNQMIAWGAGDVAKTLGIPKENVRLVSPFIGGGFGGKLFVRADAILAALGARAAGRPVKLAGAAAAVDLQQHHPSRRDHPANPDCRRARWQDRCDRPRKLVRQSEGRRSRDRGGTDPAVVCRRQPDDGHAIGFSGPARGQRDACARRGAGHDGAGNRDG